MRKTYLLNPKFNTSKSFYGKAKVTEENGKRILTSYSTDVAEIINGKPYVKGIYSKTTLGHIKDFLKQEGFKAESSKQIMKDYGRPIGNSKPISNVRPVSNGNNLIDTTVQVARLGDIFGKNLKESNAWKQRMLKAGLSNMDLSFPENWGNLSEKEKARRLNNAIGRLGKR